jgi:hypothetical protein
MGSKDVQVRVYARNMCAGYSLWRWIKPSLRLPVIRVWSPDFRVTICRTYRNDDIRIVWNGNFLHFPTI